VDTDETHEVVERELVRATGSLVAEVRESLELGRDVGQALELRCSQPSLLVQWNKRISHGMKSVVCCESAMATAAIA